MTEHVDESQQVRSAYLFSCECFCVICKCTSILSFILSVSSAILHAHALTLSHILNFRTDWFRECFSEFGRLHEKIDHLTNLTLVKQNSGNKENSQSDSCSLLTTFTKRRSPDEVEEFFENLKTNVTGRKEVVSSYVFLCILLSSFMMNYVMHTGSIYSVLFILQSQL